MGDLELQQYLFDLQGYLVIENVLTPTEVATLNQLIDQQNLPTPDKQLRFGGAAGGAPAGPGFLAWGQPFCDLLDHMTIMPMLRLQLGDCFRLDRIYGIQMCQGMPRGHLHAAYGATSSSSKSRSGEYHHFDVNEIHSGFTVVTWSLSDAGPEYGGFCCIPGSHKSNYKLPQQIFDDPAQTPCIEIPPAPAGSAVLFSEALTHGTAAWYGEHQRRTLLYKYCVSHTAWSARRVSPPDNVKLTPRQRILFSEPADPYRFFPSLFEEAEDDNKK